jgi:hypothetical protein
MERTLRFHGLILFAHMLLILGILATIAIVPYRGQNTDPRFLFMLLPVGMCLAISLISVAKNWVAPVRIGFMTSLTLTLVYLLAVYSSNPSVVSRNILTINQETQNFMTLGFWLYAMFFAAGVLLSAMFIPKKHLG